MSTPTKHRRNPIRRVHAAIVHAAIAALALALATGCTSLVTPHHVYAPLLDHAGQVDISVRGGPSAPGGGGASLNVAYAPIDNFELVAGGDFALGSTKHYAGQFGVGVFAREDVLRLEAIFGLYGGVAEGQGNGFDPPGTSPDTSGLYDLEGPYLLPYAQFFIGFEREHFELAGGVRLTGFFSDVDITPVPSSAAWHETNTGYERAYIEPTVTVRFPFDWFRIDLTTGFPIAIAGENSPAGLAPENDLIWYLAAGVGFQLDTIEQPEPEPYYEPVPQPVIVQPAPVPPSYQAPPAVVPAPPPASDEPPLLVPVPTPPPASEPGAVIVPIPSPPPSETP